jgi:hypothetical protein
MKATVASRVATNPAKDSCLSRTRLGSSGMGVRTLRPRQVATASGRWKCLRSGTGLVADRSSLFIPKIVVSSTIPRWAITSAADQQSGAGDLRQLRSLTSWATDRNLAREFSRCRKIDAKSFRNWSPILRNHRPFRTRGPVAGCGLHRSGWRKSACRWVALPPSCRRGLKSPGCLQVNL